MENSNGVLISREFLDQWDRNYFRFKKFLNRNVAASHSLDEELREWADIQMQIQHLLPSKLSARLSLLDYDFSQKDVSWNSLYDQLVSFKKINGHALPPVDQEHELLRDWLNRQILNRKQLSASQFKRLDILGVNWDMPLSRDHGWEIMFSKLQNFYKAFGHYRVPTKWENDRQLALWVVTQRRLYKAGRFKEDRQKRLNEAGFIWNFRDQYDVQWERFYQELALFHQKHKHCHVPSIHGKLVSWIERQRLSRSKGLLLADRETKLNKLHFQWNFDDVKNKSWDEKYLMVCEYQREHGHSFVPVMYKKNRQLGTWVSSQRWLESGGRLAEHKKAKLNALGFIWNRDTSRELKAEQDAQWEIRFEKLNGYRQLHGTCQVSLKLDPYLQRWTCWQRKMFFQGKLSNERIGRLNEICFPWCIQESYWMKKYDELVQFKNQFGHTRVPVQWDQNPQLSSWIYRTRLNKSGLGKQKIELLNNVGFDWLLNQKVIVPWEVMLDRLIAFKDNYGHTSVPASWPADKKLGKWVSRIRYEKAKQDPGRIKLLDAVKFDWIKLSKAEQMRRRDELLSVYC